MNTDILVFLPLFTYPAVVADNSAIVVDKFIICCQNPLNHDQCGGFVM